MSEFKIPFGGRAHNYTEEEIESVVSVMRTGGTLTQGAHRVEFEERLKTYSGAANAFVVNSATSALELAATLCQLDSRAEIVIPGHTFTSSAYPFAKHGVKIVWADIDSKTHVVSLAQIEKLVSEQTRAILVPHLYGYGCDMNPIREFAAQKDLILIEDAAQAFGVEVDNQKVGTFGDLGIFSFHSHKNITTLGEGGALLVKDDALADLVPMLRHNGHCGFSEPRDDYWIPAMGNLDIPQKDEKLLWPGNYCLGEAECALGTRLLKRADKINSEKRKRAIQFIDALAEFNELRFVRENTRRHNYHLLAAEVIGIDRDAFIRRMAAHHRIQCVVQYYPLYRYPFYKKIGLGDANCPFTDRYFDRMVSFPFSHLLDEAEIDQILEATKESVRHLRSEKIIGSS